MNSHHKKRLITVGLRGAATLELRAAAGRHASEDQKTLARGARLPVRMPEGKNSWSKSSSSDMIPYLQAFICSDELS